MPDDLEAIQASIDAGDAEAAERLLPQVYDHLRKLAHKQMRREAPGQTLQTTALVHEAYIRLLGPRGQGEAEWEGKRHFFGAAAKAMRCILVDRARARGAAKRGGDRLRLDFDPREMALDEVPAELIDLDEALTRFSEAEPQKAELVSLRYFGGLTIHEAATLIGISPSTADRHWAFARAWLLAAMQGDV